LAEVDYSKLTYEELTRLIEEEEERLKVLKADLASAEARKTQIEAAIAAEKLLVYEERVAERAERIKRYEESIAELEAQIARFQERIARRADEITRIEEAIARLQARLPRLSPVERFITRETITRLRRTLAALRGWQTRDNRYLSFLRETFRRNMRVLAALKGWQTREEPLIVRLERLRAALAETLATIERLKREIREEEERLKKKRKYLPKFWKSHIIVSLTYFEDKMFEVHILIPHLKPAPTEQDKTLAKKLAYELLLDYGVPKSFLNNRNTDYIYGLVQTHPIKTFQEKSTSIIFDVKTTGSPSRRLYIVTWKHEPPDKIVYVSYTMVDVATSNERIQKWDEELRKHDMETSPTKWTITWEEE